MPGRGVEEAWSWRMPMRGAEPCCKGRLTESPDTYFASGPLAAETSIALDEMHDDGRALTVPVARPRASASTPIPRLSRPHGLSTEPPFVTLQKSGFSAFGTSESLLL